MLAILVGYFAMEHKANQLLVLEGYKIESHICTQMALSRILDRKDLARTISKIFDLRQNINYRLFLERNETERTNAEHITQSEIIPFIAEIDNLIDKKNHR